MLKKKLLAAAMVGAFGVPGVALAQEQAASAHTLTGNFTLTTDYVFRGVSQTSEDAAVQGGFDYAHSSGLYLGTWASNVSFAPGSIEVDAYGGWSGTWGDWGMNVGALHYDYPGNSSLNTDEIYLGGTWKWFNLKYSHTISDSAFGVLEAKGTGYAELNFSYALPMELVIGAHYGSTMFDGESAPGAPNSDLDYDDWKLSIGKAWSGFNFTLAYTGTDYDPAGGTPDIFDDRVLLSVGRTF